MSATSFRTVYVDAVNGRGTSLSKVEIDIYRGDAKLATVTKLTQGFLKIQAAPKTIALTLVARLGPVALPPVTLEPGRTEWTFKFENQGAPSVLFVCALPLETEAVRLTLSETASEPFGGPSGDPNLYWSGAFLKDGTRRRVLIATSGMGNNNAAVVATHALRSFIDDIDHLVMVGIAGGCPNYRKPSEHVRLGDIVVVDHRGIIQYDFLKRSIVGDETRAHPQRPAHALLQAASALDVVRGEPKAPWAEVLRKASKSQRRFQRPDEKTDLLFDQGNLVKHPEFSDRRSGMPFVHRGAIGSANILMKDPTARDRIRDLWNVRAIEMEGSGVLDAGWSLDKDVMIVRGICDYCDEHKSDVWQAYAALAAASYARSLIEMLPASQFA